MLSKVDLRDFFEINQGLYGEPVSAAHHGLAQAFGLAGDTRAAAQTCDAHPHEHTTKR
jgi:hypothetical protein